MRLFSPFTAGKKSPYNEAMKSPAITLSNSATFVLSVGTFLALTLLLPITQNFVEESKLYIFVLTTAIMGILFAISIVRRGAIEMVMSKVTFVLLGFVVAMIASTFFTSPYPVKNILSFGGILISAGLLALFAAPLLAKSSKKVWLTSYSVAMFLVVMGSTLEMASVGPSKLLSSMGPFTAPLQAVLFNITGSILNGFQLALIGVVGIGATWYATKKANPLQLVTMIGLLVGVAIYGYYLLPGRSPIQLPSLGASWSIALDSIRDPRGALIGSGTGAYQAAYQQFKPGWVNATDQWSLTFTGASNTPLTLLTISGFIGLLAWVGLVIVTIIEARESDREEIPVVAMLLTTFVLQLLLPPSLIIIGIQAALFALFIAGRRHTAGVLHFNFFQTQLHHSKNVLPQKSSSNKWPLYITSSLLILGIGFGSYTMMSYYAASYYSFMAALAFQNDDALTGYNNQQTAIALNSFLDTYRRDYALTSLGIAEILANKTDKTTEDESTIAQLIQQAVREAQAANVLDPRDARNPLVAANIYQRLIGGVDGAEGFAEQYYVQGINLFPTAPDPYIALAGIYMQREDWNNAISILNQGLRIKADYPNLLYNIAFALEQAQAIADARVFYERTRSTITDTNSEDYTTLTAKIDELASLIAQLEATQSAQQNAGAQGDANALRQNQNPSALDLNLNPSQGEAPAAVEVDDTLLSPEVNPPQPVESPTDQTPPTPTP